MDKKLYVLLALFFPLFLSAQTNYKPGVIVDAKGDTLRGLINYLEWNQNPETIDFKYKINSAPQHLGAKALQYFGVNGYEYYRRYTVNISLSTTELQRLTDMPDTSSKTATVFLKILQTGKNAILFSYTDNLKKRFYIADNADGKPEELKYLLYLNPDDNNNLVTRRVYQGQLSLVAGNHHIDISGDLAETQYDERGLVKIVSKINDGQNLLAAPKSEHSLRFFARVSGAATTLSFSGNPNTSVITGNSSSLSPQVAVGFDAFFNPNVGRLAIRVELSASTANYSISNSVQNEPNVTTTTSSQLKQYIIALSPMLIYNFYNTKGLKVYASVGFKLNAPIYPTNTYNIQTSSAGVPGSTVNNGSMPSLQMESFFLSIPVKVGIMINRQIDIYAGYCISTSLTNYETTNSKLTAYQAGINYFFGK